MSNQWNVLRRIITQNWVLISVCVTALLLRLVYLDLKPAHFDEGINGWFVSGIWDKGFYNYDPSNFHGPLYFYFLQLTEALLSDSLWAYRFANGILSFGIVILLFQINRFKSYAGTAAALFMALSTCFVFYSRYAIHETFFVFFQVLFFIGYILWRNERGKKSLLMMVAGVYGTILNKETFFIFFGTLIIAEVCLYYFKRFVPEKRFNEFEGVIKPNPPNIFKFYSWLLGGVFTLWIFSGFGMDPDGIQDAFRAFAFWTKTGTETGHAKAIYYYLQLGLLYDPYLLIGLATLILPIFYGDYIWRLSALVGFGLFAAYTIIPYKTPWLILSFIWPFFVHLGFCFAWALDQKAWIKSVAKGWLVASVLYQTYCTYHLNFINYENPKEKYVYVQTREPIHRFLSWFRVQASEKPSLLNLSVNLGVKDTWPLPWLFEFMTNVSHNKSLSEKIRDKDIILIDEAEFSSVVDILEEDYFYWRGPLRDSMADIAVFVKAKYFPNGIPNFKAAKIKTRKEEREAK